MALRLDAVADVMAGSRMLRTATLRYAEASWRLSSGSRVPTAAFDASGLAVGTKLRLQAQGWQQAQRNVQDGLSAATVAEGAMDELSHLVGRLRELAVYSANGTLTDPDRSAIQDEVNAVRQNIDQVVYGTNFNGNPLLQGQKFRPPPEVDADGPPVPTPPPGAGYVGITTTPGVTLVGNATGTTDTESGVFDVDVTVAPTQARVAGAVPAAAIPAGAGAAINLTISGPGSSPITVTLNHGDTPAAMVTKINTAATAAGMQITASLQTLYGPPDQYLVIDSNGAGGAYQVSVSAAPDPADPAPIVPSDYLGFFTGAVSARGTDMQATINGVQALVTSTIGSVQLSVHHPGDDADGISLSISDPQVPGTFTPGAWLGNINVTAFPWQTLDLDMPIQSGPNSLDEQPLTIKPMTIGPVSLNDTNTANRVGTIDLSTQAGAQAALPVLDAALDQIGQARGRLGGDVNTLQKALDVAATTGEQQATASAHIMDSDVAKDAAEMAQAQILQSTATAAIAHANLQVVAGLRLISNSRISVPSGAPQTSERSSESAASGGSSAPAGRGGGGGSAPSVGGGSGASSMSLPGAGGFSPMPVAGGGAFSPMPVLAGSGALAGGGSPGFSADEMASMISNSLS